MDVPHQVSVVDPSVHDIFLTSGEHAANDMRLSWPGARVDSPTC